MVRRATGRLAAPAPLRLRSELARTLDRVTREIDTGLRRAQLDSEAIHDLHRDLRRLAIGLSVWRRLVPATRESEVAELASRLRRLARLVGRVRDRDVTAELLAPPSRARRPPKDDPAWTTFLGRLRDDSQAGRELLRAFLTSERHGGLFNRAADALTLAPRRDASESLHGILGEERRRRQSRVRRAHHKARRDPSSERLHRLRIRIRQWRQLTALEGIAGARRELAPPPAWQRLQSRLGRLHDLDVALATVPEDLMGTTGAGRLISTRRTLRGSVRRTLDEIAERRGRAAAPPRARKTP